MKSVILSYIIYLRKNGFNKVQLLVKVPTSRCDMLVCNKCQQCGVVML